VSDESSQTSEADRGPTAAPRIISQIDAHLARFNDAPEKYRSALKLGSDAIHEAFEKNVNAATLLSLRTAVVDHILQLLWQEKGEALSGLALLAVGGYGRGELHPHSDVDIAILLPAKQSRKQSALRDAALSEWITSLWDLNLDIGHRSKVSHPCSMR